MRVALSTLIAAGSVAVFAHAASAQVVTSMEALAVTTDAKADDTTLNNRITNLMNVTLPTGQDWTNSEIKITLTAGSVYNATNAVGTESSPGAVQPFWGTAGFRNGPFDTFVNSKNLALANVAGRHPSEGTGTQRGLSGNNAPDVSVAWFNNVLGEDGTFSVGRFTLSTNATGSFFGASFGSNAPGVPVPFSGTISNGVMTIPEPGTAALLGVAAVGLLARRRQRA